MFLQKILEYLQSIHENKSFNTQIVGVLKCLTLLAKAEKAPI